MASYVLLSHYTHQGIECVKQSPDRVDALKKIFTQHGQRGSCAANSRSATDTWK